MSLRYRPEIDGLRTVAVLSVLVYHLKTHFGTGYLFAGGFLGVDVFFVLSGYLITAILLREIAETNRISVARFYERRARRILPALFLVMAASTLVALAILMPSDLETFMKSLLASIFFISNMFWHSELGAYGAADGMYHPFLHTWSLAVEEQFYIFFPLVCLLLFRLNKRLILPTLIAMFLGGLVFAQVVTDIRPQLSFFWLPSRVWELVAGAILAQLALHHGGLCRGRWPDRVLPWVGMALILGPILTLSLGSITHPGLSTLPVVLGSLPGDLVRDPENPVIRLLSSKPFTWVGLISYALYLWHYPIYAFVGTLWPNRGGMIT